MHFPKKTIKRFDLLPSTNDFATKWCQSGILPPEGSIVLANHQTEGKGQTGNTWLVEAGKNLTFSLIYYPSLLSLDRLFALNMVASLAVLEVVKQLEIPNATVKWPNDVLIGSKKVAGILIRNSLSGKQLSSSIIGIGLNVNQVIFPTEISHATSIAKETGEQLDQEFILNHIILAFETRFLALQAGEYHVLKKEYLANLYKMGTSCSFARKGGEIFDGTILGVEDSGLLRVAINDKVEAFDFQAIKFNKLPF